MIINVYHLKEESKIDRKSARNIYLNGKEITIDENGDFKEEIISKYPYTLIVINATDKYEKTREKTFDVGKE